MSIDRDYQIRIKTSADNTGAEDAQSALNKVGGASKEAGEMGEKSAEGMFEKHHELHMLLHAIGNDAVPGMGHAFAALAAGPLGAITAIALVVELVKRNIEDTNKRLDDLAAGAAKAFGGSDSITDFANATQEAADETERLDAAMRKAADAGDAVKNRYNAETAAITAAIDALKEKLKAQEEDDVRQARKSGASPDVVAAMEADIHARYDSRSKAVQDAADRSLQIAKQRELFERQQNDPGLQDAAKGALTSANVIASRDSRASELSAQEQVLAKATSDLNTKANDDLNEKIENLKYGLENMRKNHVRESLIKTRESEIALLESESAETRKEGAEERIKQLSKEVAADKAKEAAEKELQEKTQTAATDNAKRIVELTNDIAVANAVAQQKAKSVPELTRAVAGAEDTKTFERAAGVDSSVGMADFVLKFAQSQNRLQNHQGSKADQDMVRLMNQILISTQEGDRATHDALLSAMEAIANHKDWMRQELQNVQNRLLRVINSKGK